MKNVPILLKFLLVMAVFGVFTMGVTLFVTTRFRAAGRADGELMNGEARAALLIARANRTLVQGQAAIANLLIATSASDNARYTADIRHSMTAYRAMMAQAAVRAPKDATAIRALERRGRSIIGTACARSIRLGDAATTQAADMKVQAVYLVECAPLFPPVVAASVALANRIDHRAAAQARRLSARTGTTILTTFALILGGLALVLTGGFFGIRAWIVRPIKTLETTMSRLAAGDHEVEVGGGERRDEIGGMARTVRVFKDASIEKIRLEAQAARERTASDTERACVEADRAKAAAQLAQVVGQLGLGLEKLAAGMFTFRLTETFNTEYEKIRHNFNDAIAALQETMKLVSANTAAIRSGTSEIAAAADDLSRRTEQQAASLEQTAAALDQITATVRKTAEGAAHARESVGSAQADAERSGVVVREAVAAMSGIEASSQRIGNIIGVINEIAFQTNLLALNAGVEAARAGDAGRGFAVVASEVRALAQRSADAAKEIKALISASTQQVVAGVDLVGQTGSALERIVRQIVDINGIVVEISASAQEQATGLNEVNVAVNQMDQVTQQNAAMVEQSTAATHGLTREAEDLAAILSRFQITDGSDIAKGPGPMRSGPLGAVPMRAGSAKPPVRPAPRATPARSLAVVGGGGGATEGWEEF